MKTARIHSVETCGTVDGPGLRYVTFFQGCNLRCKYCHNPDTWRINSGTVMTVSELLDDVLKYKSYIQSGGFTASGGEPLQQAQFIAELFKQLKHHNIHTAIDTSGHTSGYAQLSGSIQELLSYTDLVLLDIKSINPDKYRELTAVDIHTTLQFAEYLSVKNIPVWIRYVIVPGLTDNESEMEALAKYLCSFSNIERVELLPFHKMGEHKWEAMKLPYYLKETPVPGNEIMQSAKEIFDKYSLPA